MFIHDQILQRVLKGCSHSMLCSLSLTACQFMEEPGMAVQVRESKHPYDNNTNFEVGKMPFLLLYHHYLINSHNCFKEL